MTSKSRSKSTKLVTKPKTEDEKKKFFSTLVRRTLHTSVVTLNLIALAWFGFRCFQAVQVPELASMEIVTHGFNYMPYFFSFWVSALQYVYFSLYSIIDTLEILSERRKHLHQVIDRIHAIASYLLFTIVFPLSLMVGILFWTMYHWDRSFIYPKVLDDWVSQWPNHVMHTLPIPLSIMYMLVSNKKEPPKLLTLSGLMAFLGVYSCIFFSVKITSGKYVYLCLEKLPPTGVPLALSFALLSPILFHSLGYKINDFFKKISRLTIIRKVQVYVPTLRKCLHSVVIMLNPLAAVCFARGVFRVCQDVPEFAKSEFLEYGKTNLPYLFSLWVSAVQVAYFGMYSFIDALEIFSKRGNLLLLAINGLHTAASFILFAIVFPSTMTVGILFWTMYHWDRTYIYPPIFDDWLPIWGNHFLYTLPMLLSFTYMLISNKEEPPRKGTLALLLAFLSIYAYIFFEIRVSGGKWVHLCLEHLSPVQIWVTLSFAATAPIFFHRLGYKINELITHLKLTYLT